MRRQQHHDEHQRAGSGAAATVLGRRFVIGRTVRLSKRRADAFLRDYPAWTDANGHYVVLVGRSVLILYPDAVAWWAVRLLGFSAASAVSRTSTPRRVWRCSLLSFLF